VPPVVAAHDRRDASPDEIVRPLLQRLMPAARAEQNRHAFAFYEARLTKAFEKTIYEMLTNIERLGAQPADNWHRRLLRARGERPGSSGTASQLDELAPSHSITSVAWTSNDNGTFSPIALAALMLIIISNFVGS
jgi:hypothetical protein